jgi:hypothetical protein
VLGKKPHGPEEETDGKDEQFDYARGRNPHASDARALLEIMWEFLATTEKKIGRKN